MSSAPMDRLFVFLSLVSFFLLLRAASDAAMSPKEAYWHTVLPNTPMPRVIADRLSLGQLGGGGTTVNVGHGGVSLHVAPYKEQPPEKYDLGGNKNYGSGNNRNYGAAATQTDDDPNFAEFFLESNLHPGTAMTFQFTRSSTSPTAFLPRREAEAIPFSTARLQEILHLLSIQPGSLEAETTVSTLRECEFPASLGEKKLCATSLESLVDFIVANMGTRRVVVTSTAVSKAGTPLQTYTIEAVRKAVATEGRLAVCHAEKYAYAVFYCHTTEAARAYTVSLVGADGTKVEAVAVCHTDTAGWNPNHVAFKMLKVRPGTVPVCHYLSEDNLVWSRSN